MTIEDKAVVDFATVDEATAVLRLTIADHLPWEGDELGHISLLLDKLNAYLRYLDSGQAWDSHPGARTGEAVIELACLYPPSDSARPALRSIEEQCADLGFRLVVIVGRSGTPLEL